MPAPARTSIYLPIALALSFAVYLPSLDGRFVFDDIPTLVDNDCHRGWDRVAKIFDFRHPGICNQRPVRFLSFVFDHALWGQRSLGYHISNVALHGLIAWLALLLLVKAGLPRATGLMATGLFLVHPIATEAVAYVSGRRDLLMALFSLLTGLAYLSYLRRPAAWRLALAGLTLLLAMFSHESAVSIPAVIGLYVILLDERRKTTGCSDSRKRVGRARVGVLVLLALALAFTAFTILAHNSSTRQTLWGGSLSAHVGTIFRMHGHYLGQLLLPLRLVADYSPEAFPLAKALLEPATLVNVAAVLGLIGLAVWGAKRRPGFSLAALAYFALLLPSSQIVVHHELLAEHRLYLPMLCFVTALAAGLRYLGRRWHPYAPTLLALVLIAGLAPLTYRRAAIWRDGKTLWSTTVAQVPRCARAQANLGAILAQQGQLASAAKHLQAALSIRPTLCASWMNLGQLRLDQRKYEAGIAALEQSIACKPSPDRYLALGRGYRRTGAVARAENAFWQGTRRFPQSRALHLQLAVTIQRQGRFAEAISRYRELVRRHPRWSTPVYRLSRLLLATCRNPEAQELLNGAGAVLSSGQRQKLQLAQQQSTAHCQRRGLPKPAPPRGQQPGPSARESSEQRERANQPGSDESRTRQHK